MSISATEGVTYGVTGTAGTSSTSSTASDKNMFLELMVTQLRYQDPLNPADSSEMLAQTAQFTALEKMEAVAEQTAMLLSTQLAFGATTMIGKTVRWYDETGAELSGVVQGTTYLSTGPVLSVDGQTVPITDVVSVGDAPTATPTPPTATA
ncbi:flagellar hook capping FlgD N-terminal domain-containing protein [Nocardioides caeni]|uniref:Flagellar hook capping protein n=1 Tax=Nocardioides caeni TaxID=574700 RepID=A0A4S8NDS5_9ACTN|nr:flagellar hook capping FlgD N-terminal domain-containing protein [Nocardioides caeni]THV14710.1 flagellar hook capping protein [Nocardioides caeni]